MTQGPTDRAREPAINLRGIRKAYGKSSVLADLDLRIAKGEVVVVLGPSGSGKTTALKLIAGLERADAGEIRLDGVVANHLPPQRRNLGVVFQEHALFQRMSVEENIAFGLRVRRAPAEEIRRGVDAMLELTRLAEHRRKLPAQLSGGQRQRVALARALVVKPAAMLFDEPYSALDAAARTSLRREVRNILNRLGLAALFITHDQEEALELGDRIAVLNEGRVEQIGTPFDVYNHPRTEFVASFLGGANLLLGRWREGEVSVGAMRLRHPVEQPELEERQPVKVVFRPEDVLLNFQPQLLGTPHYLGKALVDEVTYVGPTERLAVRLMLRPLRTVAGTKPQSSLVDESFSDGMPVVVTRSKWDAAEIPLEAGDAVVVGLKDYRVLPHYPMSTSPAVARLL
jgi:sulfate transport system ATP-binding protein